MIEKLFSASISAENRAVGAVIELDPHKASHAEIMALKQGLHAGIGGAWVYQTEDDGEDGYRVFMIGKNYKTGGDLHYVTFFEGKWVCERRENISLEKFLKSIGLSEANPLLLKALEKEPRLKPNPTLQPD